MSKLTSDSQRRLALRRQLPVENRDTLMPCPACSGEGKRLVEVYGRYRQMPCRWCQGNGAVPLIITAAWARWQRIKMTNKIAGRCL